MQKRGAGFGIFNNATDCKSEGIKFPEEIVLDAVLD